jgi:PKD repeat protein
MVRGSTTTTLGLLHKMKRTWLPLFLLLLVHNFAWAQWCSSGATSTADSDVTLVQFNTINNNTTGQCGTYNNYTAMSTNVTMGSNYNLTVTAGTCGGNYTKFGKVFIDYNNDFDFLDAGETVFAFGPAPATNTFTQSITIPSTVPGAKRMRVVVTETSSTANVLSCGAYTWGETEDYTVMLLPSSPNDMGVTVIPSPNSGCSMSATEQIHITVTNFGTNAQNNWNVNYRVNGGPIVTEPMVGPIAAAGGMANYTFAATANMSVPGTYTIKAWTSLVSDAFAGNDTTTKVVTAIPGVNTYPYVEGFESGNGGWLPGGTLSSWTWGTPAKTVIIGAASGTKAYVTGGLGTAPYNNGEQNYILGPCFDLSSLQNPWFSCSIWWNTEYNWDGSNLQYSTDFGTTWLNVGAVGNPGNWYNLGTIIAQPGGSGEGWCGGAFGNAFGSGGWVTAAHRLDGLAGAPSVRFRITFASDGSVNSDGVAIDNIRIAEGPVANIGPDQLLCGGDSIIIDGGNFSAWQWSIGGTTRYKTITQTNTGQIWVKVTDTNGFYDFDTINISLSNPIVQIGPDSSICPGDTVFLDAGNHPHATFQWNTGEVSQTVFATTAGMHLVEVIDSAGCHKSDSMYLTVLVPPSLSLGNDTTVCANTPVVLNAGNGPVGTIYQWSTSANTQVLVVTSSGDYVASVTTPGGCAAIDTITVSHFPTPGVNLGPNRAECGNFTLDAGPGGTTYQWSTSAVTQTISASTAATYSVTVTNIHGCEASDAVAITMGVVPNVSLGPDQLLCNGQTANLNAGNPGSQFLWSTGALTQSVTVNTPGTYIVQVTNSNGCIGRDTIEVNISTLTVNLGPNGNICDNGSVVLNAGNPNMTYLWSTGSITPSITVSQPGTYSVTVTDNLGCSAGDNIVLNQVPGVVAAISSPANGTLFVPVAFTDGSTGSPTSWFWDFGDGLNAATQNPSHTYLALGSFTVTLIVTNANGCRDTTTQTILINNYVGTDDQFFASAFDLYPNPSDGIFHLYLELYKRSDLNIQVMDVNGRTVYADHISKAQTYQGDIDLHNLSKGVYVLSLEAGDKKVFKKLVIQ